MEYKESWHDKYLAWICGFANAQGAVMYFGVNDEHEIVGLDHVDRLKEDIPNKIVTTKGIVVDVNLHEQNGLEYIEVEIEPSNIPINYKEKYYYRSGSTMQELRRPTLQQFILKKMGRSWDDIPHEGAMTDDLDKAAVNHGYQDVLGNTDSISASQLTERQRRIVDRLVKTEQWNALENVLETSATLVALLGGDARTIRHDLNSLQSKGVIRRDGPNRGGRKVILKKIEP